MPNKLRTKVYEKPRLTPAVKTAWLAAGSSSVTADIKNEGVADFLKRFRPNWKNPPPYTPESMMPELDDLGAQGWELVHMQPVARVGKKGDVLFPGGDEWSSAYFCVFKRRKPAINIPT